MIKGIAKRVLDIFGYKIEKKACLHDKWDYATSRATLFNIYGINLLFDVGANIGQYAGEVRANGYGGRIISFEPYSLAFGLLSQAAQRDASWKVENFAIGNQDGDIVLNISAERGTGDTNSILKQTPELSEFIKNAAQTKQESVPVHKIDSIIDKYYKRGDRLFLKSDTQGYEKNVIGGAMNSLDKIMGMELELFLSPHYDGVTRFLDMLTLLSGLGYALVSFDAGFWNGYTGQIIAPNVILIRKGMQPEFLAMPDKVRKIGYPKMYF
jgi:FkbM family methyltransferase